MKFSEWTWADLSGNQLKELKETEESLGADILLAFAHTSQSGFGDVNISQSNLKIASIDNEQVKRLQKLEEKLQTVIIAYEQKSR